MFANVKAKLNVKLFAWSLVFTWPPHVSSAEPRLASKSLQKSKRRHISCASTRPRSFIAPRAPSEDECRHVFVDGEGYEGPRRRNTLYDSRGVKRGPGALHIKERISLLINILFLRWKFQVAVIRKKENTQSRNSLRFLWRRICSRVVNLSFMGHARGPRSFCFPTGLSYKHTYFLLFLKHDLKIHSQLSRVNWTLCHRFAWTSFLLIYKFLFCYK